MHDHPRPFLPHLPSKTLTTRQILACAMGLLLTACPGTAPDASQFGAGAGDSGTPTGISDALSTADTPVDAEGTSADAARADAAQDLAGADQAGGSDAQADTGTGSDISADTTGGPALPCANGLGLWEKSWDGGTDESLWAMAAVPTGGAIAVGSTGSSGSSGSDAVALRLSATGNVVWSKTLGGADADRLDAVAASGDGWLAAGTTRSQGKGQSDGWLVHLDSGGAPADEQTYGGTEVDALRGLAQVAGGWVLAGSTRSLGGSQPNGWLVRTDAAGQQLWQKGYGGSSTDELYGVVALADGRIAAAGANSSSAVSGSDAWLLVVDADGEQLVSKTWHAGQNDVAYALSTVSGGGFVLTGEASPYADLWIIRVTDSGDLLWKEVVPGNQSEAGRAVASWADGSFAIVGETSSSGGGALGGVDGWVLWYDANGNRLWDKKFGGGGNEWLSAAVALPSGGLLLAGRRYASGGMDGWVLRSDGWGNSDCANTGVCKAQSMATCDDQNPCTADLCKPASGCNHLALEDGKGCGGELVCVAGKCVSP